MRTRTPPTGSARGGFNWGPDCNSEAASEMAPNSQQTTMRMDCRMQFRTATLSSESRVASSLLRERNLRPVFGCFGEFACSEAPDHDFLLREVAGVLHASPIKIDSDG